MAKKRTGSFSWRKKKEKPVPAEEEPLIAPAAPPPVEDPEIVHIDLCFVFRNPEHEDGKPLAERLSDAEPDDSKEYAKLKSYKDFVSKCLKVGLTTHTYLSVEADEVYVMIGAPLKRFQDQADFADFKLLMSEPELEQQTDTYFAKVAEEMNIDQFIDGKAPYLGDTQDDKEGKARFRKYQYIYCKFENDADQSLYKSEPGLGHPFHSTHRIKLLMMMIQGESFRGGADINVGECLELKQEEGLMRLGATVC